MGIKINNEWMVPCSKRLTPEERVALDALAKVNMAEVYKTLAMNHTRGVFACFMRDNGVDELMSAAHALRASREPKPRFRSSDLGIEDWGDGGFLLYRMAEGASRTELVRLLNRLHEAAKP